MFNVAGALFVVVIMMTGVLILPLKELEGALERPLRELCNVLREVPSFKPSQSDLIFLNWGEEIIVTYNHYAVLWCTKDLLRTRIQVDYDSKNGNAALRTYFSEELKKLNSQKNLIQPLWGNTSLYGLKNLDPTTPTWLKEEDSCDVSGTVLMEIIKKYSRSRIIAQVSFKDPKKSFSSVSIESHKDWGVIDDGSYAVPVTLDGRAGKCFHVEKLIKHVNEVPHINTETLLQSAQAEVGAINRVKERLLEALDNFLFL